MWSQVLFTGFHRKFYALFVAIDVEWPPTFSLQSLALQALLSLMTRSHQTFHPVPPNCWGLCSKTNVGPPLFTLLQPEMLTNGARSDWCDQPLSQSHLSPSCLSPLDSLIFWLSSFSSIVFQLSLSLSLSTTYPPLIAQALDLATASPPTWSLDLITCILATIGSWDSLLFGFNSHTFGSTCWSQQWAINYTNASWMLGCIPPRRRFLPYPSAPSHLQEHV